VQADEGGCAPSAKQVCSGTHYVLGGDRAFLHSNCEYHFAPGGENRDLVELHWNFTPRTFSFLLEPESLWGRLERIPLGGDTVPTLPPEDLLVILCAHGCAEFWHQLKLVCDVAELIRVHEAMDWDELVREQASWAVDGCSYLASYWQNMSWWGPRQSADLVEIFGPGDLGSVHYSSRVCC
jgi:Uncharacterised nucleotidyltransferase